MRSLPAVGVLALLAACNAMIGGGGGSDAAVDASDTAVPDAATGNPTDLLDTSVLHRVSIECASADLAMLDVAEDQRIPCTVTFDGTTLAMVGVRKRGGLSSRRPIGDKTGFSIKFDEFLAGQELDGFDKLLLNAEVTDPSFLNEHLGYELYRRAGVPAKRTAYGLVTLNGADRGLFVVTEPLDQRFLRDRFGDGNQDGNLYEIPCCADFVGNPGFPELKDEVAEGRSRADLIALSNVITSEPDASFASAAGALMDLDGFITGYALDALVDHWDDYTFNGNNTYIYHDPASDRLVFLPHGMDRLFWRRPSYDALAYPVGPDTRTGRIAERVRDNLDAAYRARVGEILATAWDLDVLGARIDEVAALLDGARADAGPRTAVDLAHFDAWQHRTRAKLGERKCRFAADTAGTCGDGTIDPCESCDDDNTIAGDGCDGSCALEFCGNGETEAGEACDGPSCAFDCASAACVAASGAGADFLFCRRPKVWFDADADCQARGGVLAAPRTGAEQSFLLATAQGFAPADWWIGVNRFGGSFQAADGQGMQAAWAPAKPDGSGGQDCVQLDHGLAGAWNDMSCYDELPYVCRL